MENICAQSLKILSIPEWRHDEGENYPLPNLFQGLSAAEVCLSGHTCMQDRAPEKIEEEEKEGRMLQQALESNCLPF